MRKAVSSGALLVLYLTQPLRLLAHSGEPPAPHDLWQSWPWEPWVMITILVGALFYGRGVYTLWQRAGMGRGVHWPRIVTFALGLVTIVAALLTPLATMVSISCTVLPATASSHTRSVSCRHTRVSSRTAE